ncbi:MAG TPA: hypothetical protein DCE42_02220 [Myxococcales bacterium]|nr:hypothetical protein [Deltaproteobacteria bacterium]HAA53540.1 hypothetical protein [Myxococcales bacterium]
MWTSFVLRCKPVDGVFRSQYQEWRVRSSFDGFYHSSSALMTQTVEAALTKAAQRDCETIAMPTLATGYGPLNMTQFANGLRPLLDRSFGPIRHIGIYVLRPEHQAEIEGVLFS